MVNEISRARLLTPFNAIIVFAVSIAVMCPSLHKQYLHPFSKMMEVYHLMRRLGRYFNPGPALREEDRGELEDLGVQVHPMTYKPCSAWNQLKGECKVEKLTPVSSTSPISEDHIRFVCVADTHNRLENVGADLSEFVPPGDVLLHSGDFSMFGEERALAIFNASFGSLDHKVKILIAGNHDLTLDDFIQSKEVADHHRALLSNFIYLQDSMIELCGIKLYGSPWVPESGSWGFVLKRGAPLLRRWNKIPDDVDILMTHGPPLGYGDTCIFGYNGGCTELLNTIRHRVKPKYHVYGHIHEGYGMYTNGETVFINAAVCTKRYKPLNQPIVFDYPLPPGHSKSEMDDVLTSLKQFTVSVDDTAIDDSGQVHKAEDSEFMEID